jgi:death on curing protein
MRHLTVDEVVALHGLVAEYSGGARGLRDPHGLESAVAQPQQSFGGVDLYATLAEKAAALCFSLVGNHPFVDGNKRIGHAAMEALLIRNGHELVAPVDEAEDVILRLAAGNVPRDEFTNWVAAHVVPLTPDDSPSTNAAAP